MQGFRAQGAGIVPLSHLTGQLAAGHGVQGSGIRGASIRFQGAGVNAQGAGVRGQDTGDNA